MGSINQLITVGHHPVAANTWPIFHSPENRDWSTRSTRLLLEPLVKIQQALLGFRKNGGSPSSLDGGFPWENPNLWSGWELKVARYPHMDWKALFLSINEEKRDLIPGFSYSQELLEASLPPAVGRSRGDRKLLGLRSQRSCRVHTFRNWDWILQNSPGGGFNMSFNGIFLYSTQLIYLISIFLLTFVRFTQGMNEGMIHWLTINFIIPATPFPTHAATLRKTHQTGHEPLWTYIWVDYNISRIWIVWPFANDSPKINHDSRARVIQWGWFIFNGIFLYPLVI